MVGDVGDVGVAGHPRCVAGCLTHSYSRHSLILTTTYPTVFALEIRSYHLTPVTHSPLPKAGLSWCFAAAPRSSPTELLGVSSS